MWIGETKVSTAPRWGEHFADEVRRHPHGSVERTQARQNLHDWEAMCREEKCDVQTGAHAIAHDAIEAAENAMKGLHEVVDETATADGRRLMLKRIDAVRDELTRLEAAANSIYIAAGRMITWDA